jgi:hypothetical protein
MAHVRDWCGQVVRIHTITTTTYGVCCNCMYCHVFTHLGQFLPDTPSVQHAGPTGYLLTRIWMTNAEDQVQLP